METHCIIENFGSEPRSSDKVYVTFFDDMQEFHLHVSPFDMEHIHPQSPLREEPLQEYENDTLIKEYNSHRDKVISFVKDNVPSKYKYARVFVGTGEKLKKIVE